MNGLIGGFEGSGLWTVTDWRILLRDAKTGVIINPNQPWKRNTILDLGRKQVAKHLLGITTPTALSTFTHMAVGSGVAAAVETDTALTTELTANATRKALTNTSELSFTDTDIVFDTSVGGFRWKTIAQALFLDTDSNNGSLFSEWGVADQAAFGGGVFYNKFVSPSPFTKSASLSVTAQMLLRT